MDRSGTSITRTDIVIESRLPKLKRTSNDLYNCNYEIGKNQGIRTLT